MLPYQVHYSLALAVMGMQAVALPSTTPTALSVRMSALQKRAPPYIATVWTDQQKDQLATALTDAMELAWWAVSEAEPDVFDRYFEDNENEDNLDKVFSVFSQIQGVLDDPEPAIPTEGNDLLANVQIVPDYMNEKGELGCDGDTLALIREWDTEYPKIIVCPEAFKHGSLHKDFDGVPHIDCDFVASNGGRASWKMNVLGASLLHEYTHWTKLMDFPDSPTQGSTKDLGTGVYNAQTIDKTDALRNADSYTWYALENYWTNYCKKEYGLATEDDAKDPNVNDSTGVAPPDTVGGCTDLPSIPGPLSGLLLGCPSQTPPQ